MTDDSQPVTVADLRRELVGMATKADVAALATKAEMAELAKSLRAEIAAAGERTEQRLGVQFEELRHDMLGIARDMHSMYKDKAVDHEGRLVRLERFAGYTA